MVAHHRQDCVVEVSVVLEGGEEGQQVLVSHGDEVEVIVAELSVEGEGKLGTVLVHRHEVVHVIEEHLKEGVCVCWGVGGRRGFMSRNFCGR